MKLFLWIVCAVSLLTGVGYVLLRTNQAPLGGSSSVATDEITPPPSAAPAPVTAAEQAPPRLSKEEFKALGETVLKALPDKDSLNGLRESDPHTAPLPILRAGKELDRLAAAVHDDPELTDPAINVYRECTASGDYPISVRALCLNHFRRLSRKTGKPSPEGFAPSFVRTLADQLGT